MKVFMELERRLKEAFPAGHVVLTSSDDRHFSVVVRDEAFQGLDRLAQHRRVYAAVGDMMGQACHALEIHTQAEVNE